MLSREIKKRFSFKCYYSIMVLTELKFKMNNNTKQNAFKNIRSDGGFYRIADERTFYVCLFSAEICSLPTY